MCKALLALDLIDIPLIYIDEYSIHDDCVREYKWSLKGKSDFVITCGSKNAISVIVAIDYQGIVSLHYNKGTINGQIFADFLRQVKRDYINSRGNTFEDCILFFDNARVHHAIVVRELAQELDLKAFTNSPYSPELNPAEKFIRAHKEKLRVEIE
jgi:transposase